MEKATLASAMAKAFGEIDAATKSAANPHFKSKYADVTAVIEAIKPALIGNGLFFTQHPLPSENGITVETFLHHAGGESLSLGSLFVPANKNDAQGFGSALTYARRYALVTAFGVPTEDDDGNAASKRPDDRAAQGRNREPGAPSKTQLDAAENLIVREVMACEDEDTLTLYLETPEYKAAKALLEDYRPSALYGPAPDDCPEYVPIKTMVSRLVKEFRGVPRETMPMDAG